MKKLGDGRVSRLLANPPVGAIGLILASISIVLALYFGVKSVAKRELVLAQEKPSILVFDPGVTDAFSLTPKFLLWSRPDTDPVGEKVYGVSFAIWNNGRLSIKPGHILKSLRVRIGDETKQPIAVWDVHPSFWAREEIKIKTNRNIVEENGLPEIPINFQILEQGDGASFQVIYSGPEEINISLRGTVEGIPQNAFFPKSKLDWGELGLLSATILAWAMVARALVRRKRIVLVAVLVPAFVVLIILVYVTPWFTKLAEIPKFTYKPSIADLRE